MNLYAPFRLLAERWSAHTAELEGVNNMVKALIALAPSMTLQLVDAIVGNRKDCGLGSKGAQISKWSQVASRVEAILDETVPKFSGAIQVRADPARFSPPTRAISPVVAEMPSTIRQVSGVTLETIEQVALTLAGTETSYQSLTWARTYNFPWMRQG